MIRAAIGFFTGGSFTRVVATLLVGAAAGGYAAWNVQTWRHAEADRERLQLKLDREREARADEMVRVRNAERIADEQARREAATAARLAAARRSLAGLHDEIARLNAGELPTDPGLAALAREARTARDLLGRCGEAYRRVDGRAQELGDQVIGLQAFVHESCRAGHGQ